MDILHLTLGTPLFWFVFFLTLMPKTSDCFFKSQALARSISQKPHFLISLEGAVGRVEHNSPYWKRTDEVPHESHGPYNPTLSPSPSLVLRTLVRVKPWGRGGNHIKCPPKKEGGVVEAVGREGGVARGDWHHQIQKVSGQRSAQRLKRNTIDIPGAWQWPSLSQPLSPSSPGMAEMSQTDRGATDRWRDGGMQAEEEENKCIVLGVENGVLWRGQIAYVGEQGAEKDRGRWKLATGSKRRRRRRRRWRRRREKRKRRKRRSNFFNKYKKNVPILKTTINN